MCEEKKGSAPGWAIDVLAKKMEVRKVQELVFFPRCHQCDLWEVQKSQAVSQDATSQTVRVSVYHSEELSPPPPLFQEFAKICM